MPGDFMAGIYAWVQLDEELTELLTQAVPRVVATLILSFLDTRDNME